MRRVWGEENSRRMSRIAELQGRQDREAGGTPGDDDGGSDDDDEEEEEDEEEEDDDDERGGGSGGSGKGAKAVGNGNGGVFAPVM